ncbi:MauE/DoxX family redox-associated membrane protein [Streptomyces lavendofoliae]|uniref:MauE/DoxX family redox-associated membrane protein n=1 Tax=Streptomyces lavendofoliae TaxID=67314 RepID=UPI00300F6A36
MGDGFSSSVWWWVQAVLQVQVGALFLVAAWAKSVLLPEKRMAWLVSLRSVPGWSLPVVAAALSPVETVVGVAVLLGAFGVVAPVAAGMLLAVFTLVVAGVLVRRLEVDCGCFGALGRGQMVSGRQIVRNLALLAVCAALVLLPGTPGVGGLGLPAQAAVVAAVSVMFAAMGWRRRRRVAAAVAAAGRNADQGLSAGGGQGPSVAGSPG